MAVYPYHSYSNEAERANYENYDDRKLKKKLVSMEYTQIFQHSAFQG